MGKPSKKEKVQKDRLGFQSVIWVTVKESGLLSGLEAAREAQVSL